jgi:hypothetical protein
MAARAGFAALEGAAGTALADAVVLPDLANRGEDVGWADAANDIAFGAVIGAGMGAAGKVLGDRLEARRMARETAHLRDRQTAGRALEKAMDDLANDRPVDVSSIMDTPEGARLAERAGVSLQDMTPERVDPTPEAPVMRGTEAADELTALAESPEVRMVQELERTGVLTEDDVTALRDAGRSEELATKMEEAGLTIAECIAGAAI